MQMTQEDLGELRPGTLPCRAVWKFGPRQPGDRRRADIVAMPGDQSATRRYRSSRLRNARWRRASPPRRQRPALTRTGLNARESPLGERLRLPAPGRGPASFPAPGRPGKWGHSSLTACGRSGSGQALPFGVRRPAPSMWEPRGARSRTKVEPMSTTSPACRASVRRPRDVASASRDRR